MSPKIEFLGCSSQGKIILKTQIFFMSFERMKFPLKSPLYNGEIR
jgi:hypothetical protein